MSALGMGDGSDDASHIRQLRSAREAFLEGHEPPDWVRPEIRRSWYRSLMAGVSPSGPMSLQRGAGVNVDCALLRAARPVVNALIRDLSDSHVWIQVVDRDAQVVGQWATDYPSESRLAGLCDVGSIVDEGLVGTTVLGTVLEERRPMSVWGPEHFHENLSTVSGAGAPIVHPGSGVLQGAVSVGCDLSIPMGMLSALVNQAAKEIGTALVTGFSRIDRELLDVYLRVERRGPRRPVIAVNSRVCVSNMEASLHGEAMPSHEELWDLIQKTAAAPSEPGHPVHTIGSAKFSVRLVHSGDDLIGGLVQLVRSHGEDAADIRDVVDPSGPTHVNSSPPRPQTGALATLRADALQLLRTAPSMLLFGPIGAGKVSMARWAAAQVGLDLRICTATEFLASEPGHMVAPSARSGLVITHVDVVEPEQQTAFQVALAAAQTEFQSVVGTFRTSPTSGDLPNWLESQFDAYLRVPSVAELSRDLPILIAELLEIAPENLDAAINADVVRALQERGLPGNLTQLKRVLLRAQTLSGDGPVSIAHLPRSSRGRSTPRHLTPLERVERDAISSVLMTHDGNKVAAAQALEMSRSTFYRRLTQLGIA